MHTHQRQVHTDLYPAQHALYIVLVGVLVAGTEESAGIVCPPGKSRCLHAEACHNLSAQGLPVVAHVAAPQGRAVALDARESAARQYHRFLACCHQSFIHRLVHQQGEHVSHLFASPLAVVHAASCQVVVLGLRGVLPPGVNAQGHQSLAEVLPVRGGCIGVEEVYPVGAGNVVAVLLQLASHLRVHIHLRPHTHHQPHVHLVQAVGKCLGVGIEVLVKLHGVPPVLAPPLPVLHDDAQGNLLAAETVGRLQYLLGRVETLAAVDIAQRPLRHQRCLAGELAVGGYHLVGRTYEHGVVNGGGYGRAEHGLVLHGLIEQHGLVVSRQLCRQRVAPCLQMHNR